MLAGRSAEMAGSEDRQVGRAGRGGAVSGGFDLCGERLFYSFPSSVSFITHVAERYSAA